jgi:hypothetical protein
MSVHYLKIALCVAMVLLTGCATTSKVVPAGQDTFMVSAANDTCGNCTPPQIRATEQASAYCANQSKEMVMKYTKEEVFDIGFGKRITLTFACVAKQ